MSEKMINENNEKLESNVSSSGADTTNHYDETAKNNRTYERQNNKWLKLLLWTLLIGVILWIILGQKTKNQTPFPTPAIDSTQLVNDSTNTNDTLTRNNTDTVIQGKKIIKLH